MNISRDLVIGGMLSCLLITLSASVQAAPTVTNLTLVSEKRVSRTAFEYTYKATFLNDSTNWTNLSATLTAAGPGTTVPEGGVVVGALAAGQPITPDDTITLRQERTSFFDRNALVWSFGEIPPPPTTGTLLPGNAADLAIAAVYDRTTNSGVTDSDIATSVTGERFALTRLVLELGPTATVGEVNAALVGVSGRIISMLANVPIIVFEIPNPGSLVALESIIGYVKTLAGVRDVFKEGFLEPFALPPGIMSADSSAVVPIANHLAIRAHAAWNVLDSKRNLMDPPGVVMADLWGGGAPTPAQGFNVNVLNPSEFATVRKPNYHGYHVLGIMGAAWDDLEGTPIPIARAAGLAGMLPKGFELRGADILNTRFALIEYMVGIAKSMDKNVVINTSVGYLCNADTVEAASHGNAYKKIFIEAGLSKKVLHVTAAGNVKNHPSKCPLNPPIFATSPFTAAALNPAVSPNLSNIIVVENVIADGRPFLPIGPNLAPICTNEGEVDPTRSKNVGSITGSRPNSSIVSGVGTDVYSFNVPGGEPLFDTGTSMAAPQVAALAVWLWSLQPTLTVPALKDIISSTAHAPPVDAGINSSSKWGCSLSPMAPVVDAYRATLALDAPEEAFGKESIRMALLDVARSDFTTVNPPAVTPDKKFDTADLRLWVKELLARKGSSFDYSRYDLNGDGQTGEIKSTLGSGRSFDLNANKILEFVTKKIAGVDVSFNESALSDAEILCYYAYSPLYTGGLTDGGLTDGDLFERSVLMIPILNQCGVKLKSVAATIGGSASGYTLPTTPVLRSFGTPIVSWAGFWSGTGTCGGEQGGPVWSSTVTTGAYFLPATVIVDAPMPSSLTFNRMPCSSFFAVNDGKIWLNATGRRYQNTSGFISDREYQTRYFSDPEYGISSDTKVARESTRKLRLGSVNVPAGSFFQSNLLTESTNTVEPIIFEFEAQ